MDFSQYLKESNLNDLYQSTINSFNTVKRQYATDPIVITELTWIPFLGTKSLFIKGLAQSDGKEYNPIILFKKVNYHEKMARGLVEIYANDGRPYILEKVYDNEVLVRCNCKDYYWRGSYANWLDNCHYGSKRKKYESMGARPPVNPDNNPMICKHLIKLTKVLNKAGLL